MSEETRLEGIIAPVITPFAADGTPDTDRFVEMATWLLGDGGCNALAPFGTTSEANSIGLDERMGLLEELVDSGIDPALLMPGTGTCSVADTVMLTQHAMDLDCGGVLMLPPFYYKSPSDEGLYRFYSEVIEETADNDLALYLYHIPQVSGVGLSLELVKRLKDAYPDNLYGLKDSSGDWSNMQRILEEVQDFDLFPGTELYLRDGLNEGAAGVISAVANINGVAMRRVYDAFDVDADPSEIEALQAPVSAFRKALQAYPMIPAIKAIVAHYRNDELWAAVRPPFVEMPPGAAREMVEVLRREFDFKLSFETTV
ncbi:MAG: dihydrodipicolinate synthase family protein [Hyphomicrobiaceae bacterium]